MKAKPSFKATLQFVLNAFLAATIIMWFLVVVVRPMLEGPEIKLDRKMVEDFAAKFEPVTADEVAEKIDSLRGKPVLLVVYASWCPVCRGSLPAVVDTLRANKTPLATVVVSLDRKREDAARYLLKKEFTQDFTPYFFQPRNLRPLGDALRPLGSSFEANIPYFAFFDAKGKMVTEIIGGVDAKTFRDSLEKIL